MKDLFSRYSDEILEERCGLILGSGEMLEVQNSHPEPTKGFEIDPETIIRYLDEMSGTWHTHPGQSSVLSGEDHLCFTAWPTLEHYVVGKDGIRLYRVDNGAVVDANHFPR
jgi:proteasome lid subunit RPN8/RPN11